MEVASKPLSEPNQPLLQKLEQLQQLKSSLVRLKHSIADETAECDDLRHQIDVEKAKGEKVFAAALPVMMRICISVDSLDPATINEMKCGRRRQDFLSLILDVVAIYFGLKLVPVQLVHELRVDRNTYVSFWKDSFEVSGRFILGPSFDFLKNLKTIDKEGINEETIELLEPLLVDSSEWFNETHAAKRSKAVAAILRWCLAVFEYRQRIEPARQGMMRTIGRQSRLGVLRQSLIDKRRQAMSLEEKIELLQREHHNNQST